MLGGMQKELSQGNKEDRRLKHILVVSAHLSSEFVQNCQNMEATQVASNSWADKQTGSYTE